MSFEKLAAWVATLPRAELDKPYMQVEGTFYTPRQMLQQSRKRSRVGKRILMMFLTGKHSNPGDLMGSPETLATAEGDVLAEARVRAWLARQPPGKPVVYVLTAGVEPIRGGGLYPEELLRELDAKTPDGQKLIENEKRYMVYLEELKKKV